MSRNLASPGLAKALGSNATAIAKLAGRLHFHPCRVCHLSYSCSCLAPDVNAHCQEHRPEADIPDRARLRPIWDRSRDPGPCCEEGRLEVVLLSDVITRYQLAGPGPWFACKTCRRCHSEPLAKELMSRE